MKKGLVAGMLTVAMVIAGAVPAAAKLPSFSTSVEVTDLVATVTITLGQDVGYVPAEAFAEAIAIMPAGAVVGEWRPAGPDALIRLTVRETDDPRVFVGTAELPSQGEYALVPLPTSSETPPMFLYGGVVEFSTEAAQTVDPPLAPLMAGAAATAAAVVVAAWMGGRSRRRAAVMVVTP